ncbi:MAG: hypothetical protein AAFY63_00595 [Cyanobacteria bacterium J06643_13]
MQRIRADRRLATTSDATASRSQELRTDYYMRRTKRLCRFHVVPLS